MVSSARVSTTHALTGWVIDDYRGMVAAHVVAGTGFLGDFAANLTDFFGGRSGTYQRQLASLEREAIELLRRDAHRLGANWVIGVRLDFDEISGKNKQMLMVSAHGTAVSAHPLSDEITAGASKMAAAPRPAGRGVDSSELREAMARRQLRAQAESGDLQFDNETWSALSLLGVVEAIPAVLRYLSDDQTTKDVEHKRIERDRALGLLRALPTEVVQQRLHSLIRDEPFVESEAVAMLIEMSIVDLEWVVVSLADDDPRVRRAALSLIRGDAPFYTADDLESMRVIVARIPDAFPETVEYVETKTTFGRVSGGKWRCNCRGENGMDVARCAFCGRDRHGFWVGEYTPKDAEDALRERITVLEYLLNGLEQGTVGQIE